MMTRKLLEIRACLVPGNIYKRADLQQWSSSVDYHIRKLMAEGTLVRVYRGLYLHPKKTAFGAAPAEDAKLVEAFLNDNRFLLVSPNMYNALGVGTTQLYNQIIVYNHKRLGRFKLGGRMFDFRIKPYFPKTVTQEFLLMDLANNLERLAEDTDKLLKRVVHKALELDGNALLRAACDYGSVKTRKFFEGVLSQTS